MKPEFMRVRRTAILALATLLATAGFAALSPISSASAASTSVGVTTSCVSNAWTVTWTVTNTETVGPETITASSQPALVPIGTVIAPGATFTVTETVPSSNLTKTLSVTGTWPDGIVAETVGSAQLTPYSFVGSCAPPPVSYQPQIQIAVQPCLFGPGGAAGAVSVSLAGLTPGSQYQLGLWQNGNRVQNLNVVATAAGFSTAFADQAPGNYYATLSSSGGTQIAASNETVLDDCTPQTPQITLSLDSCDVRTGPSDRRSVSISLEGLTEGTSYVATLVDASAMQARSAFAASTPLSVTTSGSGTTFDYVFEDIPTPASWTLSIDAAGFELASAPLDTMLCELSTLPPPTITAAAQTCNAVTPSLGALTVTVADLEPSMNYYVTLVDSSGATVSGGEEQAVTGVTSQELHFAGVSAPGSYTAILRVGSTRALAASADTVVSLVSCLSTPPSPRSLPTLAATGIDDVTTALAPLGLLLLTAGGAAIALARLRRRAG